jgi:hypothetical protein
VIPAALPAHRRSSLRAAIGAGLALILLLAIVGYGLTTALHPSYRFIGTWAAGDNDAIQFRPDGSMITLQMRYTGGFNPGGGEIPMRADHVSQTPGRWAADHGTLIVRSGDYPTNRIAYSVSDDGKILTLWNGSSGERQYTRVADDYQPKGNPHEGYSGGM